MQRALNGVRLFQREETRRLAGLLRKKWRGKYPPVRVAPVVRLSATTRKRDRKEAEAARSGKRAMRLTELIAERDAADARRDVEGTSYGVPRGGGAKRVRPAFVFSDVLEESEGEEEMLRVSPAARINSSKLGMQARRERTAGDANMAAEFAAAESWGHGRREGPRKEARVSRGSQAMQSARRRNVSSATLAEDEVGRGAVNSILMMMGNLRPTGGSVDANPGARQNETYVEPEAGHAEAGNNVVMNDAGPAELRGQKRKVQEGTWAGRLRSRPNILSRPPQELRGSS